MKAAAIDPFPRISRFAGLLWLLTAVGILVLSGWLQTGDGRAVHLPLFGLALPETCAMHARLGLDCPGCGLTRSFIHIADGRPLAAWRLNPASLLVFAYVVLQIPLATAYVVGVASGWLKHATSMNSRALVALVAVLLGQWLIRLFQGDLG